MSNEIKDAVRKEMAEAAEDVDALTYAEVYGFEDEQIEEALTLQGTATVTVTFPADGQSRVDRLAHAVRKLAGWTGNDITDLIDEGMLQEGDL